MTDDELLASIIEYGKNGPIDYGQIDLSKALRAVVELHSARGGWNFQGVLQDQFCGDCAVEYPCPTIQAIEKELK